MGSDSAFGEPLGANWTKASGPEPGFVGASPAAVLRALLPEAKRICSRQHRSAVWDALLAAEQLLAEVDVRREAWARAAENVADVLSPAPEPGVAEEAGP